jgi:hypothetical protein
MRTPPGRPNEDKRILSVRPVFGCGLRVNFLPNGSVLRPDRTRDLAQVASAGGPLSTACSCEPGRPVAPGGPQDAGRALIIRLDGEIDTVMAARVDGGLITGLYAVRNPGKLSRMGRETALRR